MTRFLFCVLIIAFTQPGRAADKWATGLARPMITSPHAELQVASIAPELERSPSFKPRGEGAPRTTGMRRPLPKPAADALRSRVDAKMDRLLKAPPRSLKNQSPIACLAVAIYHEARNQSELGQMAVASVILRRAAVPRRWGSSICGVIKRKDQFSFMTSRNGFPRIYEMDAWALSLSIARKALLDGPPSDLAEADHYHATSVKPSWRRSMEVVAMIGDHIFYRDPTSVR
jgi:spore germination cell wall hydrolase CwlJ-like protein